MTLRVKIPVVFGTAVLAAVAIMASVATRNIQREFDRLENQRSDVLLEQFRHEFAQRQSEVVDGVQQIAEAEGTLRMAMDLSRVQADPSVYANDARGIAASHQLDFLDLVGDDGVLISSAQWPGRIGFK